MLSLYPLDTGCTNKHVFFKLKDTAGVPINMYSLIPLDTECTNKHVYIIEREKNIRMDYGRDKAD